MKLFRTKIILLISVASLVCIGIIIFLHLYFSSSVEQIKRTYVETQLQMLQNQIKVNASPTDRALLELAGADDLKPCTLVSGGLPDGIRERLRMAGIDFMVITDLNLKSIADYPDTTNEFTKLLPSDSSIFHKVRSDGKITRFYSWLNDSIYEISATRISWCSRFQKDSTAGWLFVGKIAGSEFSNKILLQQPGALSLKKDIGLRGSSINQRTKTFITTLPLFGWNNRPVASLSLETKPEMIRMLSSQQTILLIVMLLSSAAFLLFIALYLNRYYILPVKLLSIALKNKDAEHIKMISDNDPDLHLLQNMLINIFSQERMLTDMIRQRTADHMNSFHAAILSEINEAVYATDHKGVITYWNRAAEDLYRTNEADAISKIAAVLIRNIWVSPEEKQMQANELKTNGTWQGKLVQEIPDGSVISIEASISCLNDKNGNKLGHLTIVRKSN